MQHDDAVVGLHLVDQVGGPEHAHSVRGDEAPGQRQDVGARPDVEAGGRLVEQQQTRAMDERAGDLDPAHLAAGKLAHAVMGAVGEADALKQRAPAGARLGAGDAVQRRLIAQVLIDGEIEIERAALKHDADPRRAPRRSGGATSKPNTLTEPPRAA